MRRALPVVALLAATLLGLPDARGAEPAAGTIDARHPSVTWTGTVPLQTAGISGIGCQTAVPDPTCDVFELTVGTLKRRTNDVLVAISTPDVQPGEAVELDVYVYGPDGTEAGHGTEFGSNDTVTLRDPAPGTYTVAVQAVLSMDPTEVYEASATAISAKADDPVDAESQCGAEFSPELRAVDAAANVGAVSVAGDPTPALDDAGTDPIIIDVLVYLDDMTVAEADAIFLQASAESYEPLGMSLRVAEYRTVSFLDPFGDPEVDATAIINQTKALVGGVRPGGIDIVEALVGRDIHQFNLYPIAGLADCIGGVAYDDRAFLVAEGRTPTNYAPDPSVPVVFGYDANPHVTAHEIGHLLGGQHHYANCVEGIEASDIHEDHIEASPCTLMFNAADLLGGDFDTLNGSIVRGTARRYAR